MNNKSIIISSSKSIIYENLCHNLGGANPDIILLDSKELVDNFISSPIKIDVLIIENIEYKSDILALYSKYVFSFIQTNIKHQILLKKPLNLPNFLQEIKSALSGEKSFIFVDGNIYCELRSSFTLSHGEIIKLSNIENIVLKHIFLSKECYISKEYLRDNVWKYSKKAETKTIEQTMHNLRYILPKGLLAPFEDGYKIYAKEIY